MQQLQGDNFELNLLEREVENNQRIYESFLTQMMVTNIQNDFTGSNIQIIDYATIPKFPIKPNKQLIIIFASFLGVLLGIILVLAREVINDTFKTPDDIEAKLALSALGITPIVIKQKDSTIPEKQYLTDSRSSFAESINTIRTGLLFANIDNPPKTILVTSAKSAEGKSTLAINMAVAFSNIGKTLLLEVDLRKPSMSKNLEYKISLGLSDILSGEVKVLSDVVKRINNDQLNVITSGKIPPNPMELLSSNKFEKLLATFKEHYEYIILDGPPTLPVSDSCIIANKVDAVVFAIEAEGTKIKVAKEALSRLRKLNANVVGGVLTLAEPKKMSYYGAHYYSSEYYGVKPDKLVPASPAT
jgi:succinoglycan biosynthesis transport protein ExoP